MLFTESGSAGLMGSGIEPGFVLRLLSCEKGASYAVSQRFIILGSVVAVCPKKRNRAPNEARDRFLTLGRKGCFGEGCCLFLIWGLVMVCKGKCLIKSIVFWVFVVWFGWK